MLFVILFIVAIVLPISLGWPFLGLFSPKAFESFTEKAGISFGLGLGIITVIEVFFLYLKIKIVESPSTFIATVVLISGALYFLSARNKQSYPKIKKENLTIISKVALLFIIIQGIWVVIRTFNFPIITDDGVAIWGLKAKTIYFSNLMDDSFFTLARKMQFTLSGNYPLLVPLAENYVNLFLGEWNDLYTKVIFPAYYFSFLLVFFGLLRRFTDKNYALIFSFFLGGLPTLANFATDAIADLPFTYYYFISFILIIIWIQTKENHYLHLSAIFSGLAIWTKNEGYASFLINLTTIVLYIILNYKTRGKELIKGISGFMAIIVPIIILVAYYQHLTGVKEGIINSQTFSFQRLIQNLNRSPFILYEIQRQLWGTVNKWNLLGYLFLFALLVRFKNIFKSFYFYILLAIALNFILYITVYILTPQDVSEHIGTSQYRILMHFVPLMLFFSATILYDKKILNNKIFLEKLRGMK